MLFAPFPQFLRAVSLLGALETKAATLAVDPNCSEAVIQDNLGAMRVTKEVAFNHSRR